MLSHPECIMGSQEQASNQVTHLLSLFAFAIPLSCEEKRSLPSYKSCHQGFRPLSLLPNKIGTADSIAGSEQEDAVLSVSLTTQDSRKMCHIKSC